MGFLFDIAGEVENDIYGDGGKKDKKKNIMVMRRNDGKL